MDLSKFDTSKSNDGVPLTLMNPKDGTPLIDENTKKPVTITVLGVDSKEYISARHRLQNKALKRASGGGKVKMTIESIEEQGLDLLIESTVGWTGIEVDGKPLEFGKENVRMLYARFPWIKDQVDEFVNDRANFLGNL